jgi:hypothetical protein
MTRNNREVERSLKNKFAFTDSSTRSDDHRWVELTLPGLPVIATFFSHARMGINDSLWALIARQLRVRPAYLTGMVECSNSREAYYKQVTESPIPPWDNLLRGAATAKPAPPPEKNNKSKGKGKGKRRK